MEKGEPSYTVGGNVSLFYRCGKQYGGTSKLKKEIPVDPGISLQGIYPKNTAAQFEKERCTPMFIAVVFTTAKKRKKRTCLPVDEWIKKM